MTDDWASNYKEPGQSRPICHRGVGEKMMNVRIKCGRLHEAGYPVAGLSVEES